MIIYYSLCARGGLIENEINDTGFLYELNASVFNSADINASLLLSMFNKQDVDNYIHDPMQFHNELCDICEVMFNSNGIFAQTISKMAAAPTLDYVIIPSDITDMAIKKRLEADDVIKLLNHTLLTRDSLLSHLLYGESVFILQTKAKEKNGCIRRVMLKPLNRKYVRFDGTSLGDHIVSFDLSYFDDEAINECGEPLEILATYPPEFIKAYEWYKRDTRKRWYTLPQEITFATKLRANLNERHGRPLALAALIDMIFAQEYLESQRNNLQKYSSELDYIIQPEGEKKGVCSLNNAQQKEQYNNFKNAIRKQSDRTRGYSPQSTTLALATGTTIGRLTVNPELLKNTLKKENNEQIASDLGLGLGAISGNGGAGNYASQSLNIELVLSEVYQFLEQAQEQYEKIINAFLKTDADTHVKFRYLKTSNLNRKEAFANAKDLYMISGGSRIWLYATAMGDSKTYLDLMDFERALEYEKKYLPHITSFTTTDKGGGDDSGGRPQKDVADMTDKGIETRTSGGNEGIKPSTK
jgi:hypothetical protein